MQMVARRTVTLAGLLGLGLAGVLAILADPLPQLFNPSQSVMAAIRPIFGFVIVTQPLNALAFVWDGVLYGAGGFPYAATVRLHVQAIAPRGSAELMQHDLRHPDPACLPAHPGMRTSFMHDIMPDVNKAGHVSIMGPGRLA